MANLAGYLRVSTGDQKIDSAGQQRAIEAWAGKHGHTITKFYSDEGISGAKGLDKRPGLAAAFELCRSHRRRRRRDRVSGIVAFDRSRFSRDRNLAGMLRWMARSDGFALLSTDGLDTADESMGAVATDLVADLVGEQARQAIRKATKAALAARRDAGLVAGHLPYGFDRQGSKLVPNEDEQAVVRRVLHLRQKGLSLRVVAAKLIAAGTRTRRGCKWGPEAVRQVEMGRAAAVLVEAASLSKA